MHQRHAVRPQLECVEGRVVLSVSGALAPAAQIHPALVGHLAGHPHASTDLANHHAAIHRGRSHAGTPHHRATGAAHHAHHPSSSSSSNSLTSSFSNFFKSLGL